MNGKYHIVLEHRDIKYEFDIKRNITIISDDSATGKTKFLKLLNEYNFKGKSSGIKFDCEVKCEELTLDRWENKLLTTKGSIIFVDNDSFEFLNYQNFANIMKKSDNYFVIITRESIDHIPYSYKEIYSLQGRNRYKRLERKYKDVQNSFIFDDNISEIVVEDSKSGFLFFKNISNLNVSTAKGKSNFPKYCLGKENVLVIADGAAIGPEMDQLLDMKLNLFLPESFEYLILKGIFEGELKSNFFSETYNFIDSLEYFSWEIFFFDILKEITNETIYEYSKNRLNKVYIQEGNKNKILSNISKEVCNIILGYNSKNENRSPFYEKENENIDLNW